jgi:hypothetical protein
VNATDTVVVLSFDEAVKLLPDREEIHTFRNPRAGMLMGADWSREKLMEAMREASEIKVTGPSAQSTGHGLVIDRDGLLFIEAANHDERGAA